MQAMVPLYGFGGGSGGSGGTLTVTAPAGATVTLSKDDKTKTKVVDSSGEAVFKGLSSGQWTLRITCGELSAQRTVTITADYSVTIPLVEVLRDALATTSYARLSTGIGDKLFVNSGASERYIIRTTDEPVIFAHARNVSAGFFGYAVISLDSDWAAYSYNQYGDMDLFGTGVTSNGNQYYLYGMKYMVDTANGNAAMTLCDIGTVSISYADCYIDGVTKSLAGNSTCIEQMHGFIDSMAQLRR